ncbi:MAG TPA: aminotransferase class IV [Phycisphaerae bacterium]|nr:aminotransferase class IV [Phycisphaerae bacterium]
MPEFVFLNGQIVPAADARVSVFDAGFTHAAGLFETMRAYNGAVMRLPEHIRRLQHSAAELELQLHLDVDEVAEAIMRLMAANSLLDARIRLVATPGNVPRPGQPIVAPASQTVLISASPVQAYPADLYKHGMRVCICPYRQNRLDPLAGHKTLAYLPRLIAIREAAAQQCQEALWFTTENMLAEGSVCNVFIVRDKEILTPPLDTPVLPGTTRNALIELAAANGLTLHERAIDIETLLAASEVFLTGSVLEVMPVTFIEKHEVGNGVPGPMTLEVGRLYRRQVAKECGLG